MFCFLSLSFCPDFAMKCVMDISFSNPGKVTRFDISTGTSTEPFSLWNSARLFNESARTPRGRVGMASGHPAVFAAEGGRVERDPAQGETHSMNEHKKTLFCMVLLSFSQYIHAGILHSMAGTWWTQNSSLWSGIHRQEEMEAR